MRHRLDKTAFKLGPDGRLTLAPGRNLYVYQRGTTTPATGYTTEAGSTPVTYPLVANSQAKFDAWYASGRYDIYTPADDDTEPWDVPLTNLTVAAGNLGASYALNTQRYANVLFTGTLNANNALTFTNLVAGFAATIVLTQDATGNRTLSVAGSAVAVNPTPASVTVLKVYSPDGTTVYVDAPGVDPSIVGASAKRTTAQSVANGATPLVSFESELWDSHGFINLGTSATRFTIPAGKGGLYALSVEYAWTSNSTGQRLGCLFVNSAEIVPGDRRAASGETGASFYHEHVLAAGAWVELFVYQNSGGTLNLQGNNYDPWPRLTIRRLGPSPV
jgi:hypothetical protein